MVYRAQSAMEYLMTYGWAILIISVALVSLYALGLFNPASFTHTSCIFPADFSCLNSYLSTGGAFMINIEQSTQAPINVTAIGCNSNDSATHMISFVSNQIYLQIGSNVTISGNSTATLQCWDNGTVVNAKPGSVFNGYVILNYTNTETGFPHTVSAIVIQKVT
jgi:hypothetical protein